jgi:uncharacterized protein YxeA
MQLLSIHNSSECAIVDEDIAAKLLDSKLALYAGYPFVLSCKMYLHHFVIGQPPEGYVTDHVDRNKLNNTRENLRHVTVSQNAINTSSKNGKDRHVYYMLNATVNPWYVQFRRKNKRVYLGPFKSKQEALDARDTYLKNNDQFSLKVINAIN